MAETQGSSLVSIPLSASRPSNQSRRHGSRARRCPRGLPGHFEFYFLHRCHCYDGAILSRQPLKTCRCEPAFLLIRPHRSLAPDPASWQSRGSRLANFFADAEIILQRQRVPGVRPLTGLDYCLRISTWSARRLETCIQVWSRQAFSKNSASVIEPISRSRSSTMRSILLALSFVQDDGTLF